jgi:hypothetical protein
MEIPSNRCSLHFVWPKCTHRIIVRIPPIDDLEDWTSELVTFERAIARAIQASDLQTARVDLRQRLKGFNIQVLEATFDCSAICAQSG